MMKRLATVIFFMFVIFHCGKAQTWNSVGGGFTNGGGGSTGFSAKEKLYIGVGGLMSGWTFAGNHLNGICSLQGSTIDSLGAGVGGFSGYATCVEWYNGKLIVAGNFTDAGGPTQWSIPFTGNIAAWDSTNGWSSLTPLGNPDNPISSIIEYQGNLYIGGYFLNVNNILVNAIAKWNGTSWSNVGGGVSNGNPHVNSMAMYHGQLYIAGGFQSAGTSNIPVWYIARWNGTQWDSVGRGMNNYVMDLEVDTVQDVLYACGGFTRAGDTAAYGIAMWNDTIWSPVGSGTDTLWGTHCLALYNGELYAGGGNVTITTQGDTIKNVYKYNGIKWISVDGGANNTVEEMCVFQGNLYIGGYFWQVGNGILARRIACYGTTCPLGVGISEQAPPVPFKMFPNPNDDVLHIESEETRQMIFRLSSGDGKIISEKRFFSKLDYSTRKLATGIYTVQICLSDGSRCHTEKLVVK